MAGGLGGTQSQEAQLRLPGQGAAGRAGWTAFEG